MFNFAHSYAVSAHHLAHQQLKASHWSAPVGCLYLHATELYLKAFLMAHGQPLKKLRNDFGHKIAELADEAERLGLDFNEFDKFSIDILRDKDENMRFRYIKLGTHVRPTFDRFDALCARIHIHVEPLVFADQGNAPRPDHWWAAIGINEE